jgi:hypothetical protein
VHVTVNRASASFSRSSQSGVLQTSFACPDALYASPHIAAA